MSVENKEGCSFEVRAYEPEDFSYLLSMYDAFSPKAMFQGMPPADKDVRREWILKLVRNGSNFLAWQQGNVIGHVVILPDFDKSDAEYLIFVSQTCRGKGVGKELTRAAIRKAEELGIAIVWLTVDSYNFRAIKLYKKSGFELKQEYSSASERVMVLKMKNGDQNSYYQR